MNPRAQPGKPAQAGWRSRDRRHSGHRMARNHCRGGPACPPAPPPTPFPPATPPRHHPARRRRACPEPVEGSSRRRGVLVRSHHTRSDSPLPLAVMLTNGKHPRAQRVPAHRHAERSRSISPAGRRPPAQHNGEKDVPICHDRPAWPYSRVLELTGSIRPTSASGLPFRRRHRCIRPDWCRHCGRRSPGSRGQYSAADRRRARPGRRRSAPGS